MADYDITIGFEAHCELLTESKLWCGCPNKFGSAPNTQTCPICLGMPGVLPVLNERAFELSLRAALALQCTINRTTYFDRKQYYYPDLPKNYQISQNYCNLGVDGHLTVPLPGGETCQVGILNVHLEEDAGKDMHIEVPGADYSLVDLNRAGVPLLEIVGAPDITSLKQAEAYMDTLRQILLYCEVSDCKMQEGSLRFEPSISLKPAGRESLGTRVEIKNLNSMKAVMGALEYEIARQTDLLDAGGAVAQETRLWDDERGVTEAMRSKEEAHDYRYLPDPDLVPIDISDAWIDRVRQTLPELAADKARRFQSDLGLSEYDAGVLTSDRGVSEYFEACLAAYDAPKAVANWVMNDVLRVCNERDTAIDAFPISAPDLAKLAEITEAGRVNVRTAREVFAKMIETGKDAETIVKEEGAEQVGDEDALVPILKEVFAQNEKAVADYRKGKKKAAGALVGQVMRATKGKADPKVVGALIDKLLSE